MTILEFEGEIGMKRYSKTGWLEQNVVSEINLSAPVRQRKTITFRKTTNICMTFFRADILDSSLIKNPKNELHDLCDQYTSVLTSLLDKHAPL